MSKTLIAIILFVTWPWVLWGVDVTYFALVGDWLTTIPWKGTRGQILLIVYPGLVTVIGTILGLIWIELN
ncbi:MAG: hypothetical protein BWY21_00020 [Parcubacteria group bacterium ADurb.Bin216]|nr:MAG: hypothetical protein BWY21_00020 [Parcubacteria group bacterium ADurb.Bin216]